MRTSLQKLKLCGSGAALAAFLALSGATAQPAANHVMVLEGGTLIDGTGKAPLTDAVVVVQGNRIKAVGQRGHVTIPAGAMIIKIDGRTILPGLIDSHSHTQDFNIPMFLHYGVTTFQDKFTDTAWLLAEREGIRNGTIKGPRMFIAGQNLVGTAYFDSSMSSKQAATVDEARADAQSLVDNGVDIINVNQNMNFDQLRAVIEVGKKAGLPVMGHTQNTRIAAAMGYKFQEHMWSIAAALLDPEGKTSIGVGHDSFAPEAIMDPKSYPPLIDYLVKQGVFINPTLVTQWLGETKRAAQWQDELNRLAKDPGLAFVPPEVRQMWTKFPAAHRQGYEHVAEFLREYVAAGGKVTVGTDAGHTTLAGLSEHYEMQMLVDTGIPAMQAIQAATLWNAQLMMKDKDLGSVEPGKLADFTIIEGDPLQDISTTKNVRMVIKDGAVVDTAYDPKYVNPIPGPGNDFSYEPPQITEVSPVAHQDGQTVTLDVEASDDVRQSMPFKPASIVRFDNVDLPTQYVSGIKLTATLDASLLHRSPGFYPLYVVTPGLHGTVSSAAYEVVEATNGNVATAPVGLKGYASDAPYLFGPVPRMAHQGGQTLALTVEGTKAPNAVFSPTAAIFTPASVVRFDNVDLPTKFVSSTKLTATLDAKLLQRPVGSYLLYVVNPGLYGKSSHAIHFMVLPKNSKVTWNYVAD